MTYELLFDYIDKFERDVKKLLPLNLNDRDYDFAPRNYNYRMYIYFPDSKDTYMVMKKVVDLQELEFYSFYSEEFFLKEDSHENEIRKILVENVHKMEEQNMKRIAIITKSNEEVINLYNELKKDLTKLKMINNSKDFKIGNLVILPSYISKGLEFDGVIIYTDKENEYQEKDKYLFYVVCTRAQHALSIYNQKEIIGKR